MDATTTGKRRVRLTGFGTNEISETARADVYDNETVVSVTLDPNDPLLTETINYPGTNNDAVRVTRNGLPQSSINVGQISTTFGYDGFGRRTSVTDGRGNATTTAFDSAGRVYTVTDAASNTTTYAYYGSGDDQPGRLKSVGSPAGKYTYYDYDDFGRTTHVWGDVPHPRSFTYDSTYGQRTGVSTYRSGEDWDEPNWPTGQTPDTVSFTYDAATGLMTAREDAASNEVAFTYTPDGRLKTRTWARDPNSPIVTTYEYFADPNDLTGELQRIDYSDATADIEFTYDRLGRHKTVKDAVGTRTFTYGENGEWVKEVFDPNSLYSEMQVRVDFDDVVGYWNTDGAGPVYQTVNHYALSKVAVGRPGGPASLVAICDVDAATRSSPNPATRSVSGVIALKSAISRSTRCDTSSKDAPNSLPADAKTSRPR